MTYRLPLPLDDGSAACLEVPYLPITQADADRVAALAACLVLDDQPE